MPRFYDDPEQPDPFPPSFYDPSAAGIYYPYAPFIPDPARQVQDDPGNMFQMLLRNPQLMMHLLRR
jgi:hypothetical protein